MALLFVAVDAALIGAAYLLSVENVRGLLGALGGGGAVLAALVLGPEAGAAVAIGSGVILASFAAGAGHLGGAILVTVAVWVALAVIVGVVSRGRERRLLEPGGEVEELTAELQTGLLPSPVSAPPGVSLVTRYRPGEHRLIVGGDFFDAITGDDGTLAVVIGDVSGHGPQAAALSAHLRTAWRALVVAGTEPAAILRSLNDVLVRQRATDELFATACLGWLEPDRRRFRFVLAGHPAPVVLGTSATVPLATTAPPLGVAQGETPAMVAVGLARPWGILLYTDGLIEARLAAGAAERLGVTGLIARLDALPVPGAAGADEIDALLEEVEMGNGGPLVDDVAIMLLSSEAETAAPADREGFAPKEREGADAGDGNRSQDGDGAAPAEAAPS